MSRKTITLSVKSITDLSAQLDEFTKELSALRDEISIVGRLVMGESLVEEWESDEEELCHKCNEPLDDYEACYEACEHTPKNTCVECSKIEPWIFTQEFHCIRCNIEGDHAFRYENPRGMGSYKFDSNDMITVYNLGLWDGSHKNKNESVADIFSGSSNWNLGVMYNQGYNHGMCQTKLSELEACSESESEFDSDEFENSDEFDISDNEGRDLSSTPSDDDDEFYALSEEEPKNEVNEMDEIIKKERKLRNLLSRSNVPDKEVLISQLGLWISMYKGGMMTGKIVSGRLDDRIKEIENAR